MTEVESVENPDGEVDRSRNFTEFEDGLKSAHRRKKEELVLRHCLDDQGSSDLGLRGGNMLMIARPRASERRLAEKGFFLQWLVDGGF